MDIPSVNMYIETSLHNPQIGKGAGMWIMEHEKNGITKTKEGFVYGENTRENELALKCLVNLFFLLGKSYMKTGFADVFTGCVQLADSMITGQFETWKRNGWKNAKGNPLANASLWEQASGKMEPYTVSFKKGHHEYSDYMQYQMKTELERRKRNV